MCGKYKSVRACGRGVSLSHRAIVHGARSCTAALNSGPRQSSQDNMAHMTPPSRADPDQPPPPKSRPAKPPAATGKGKRRRRRGGSSTLSPQESHGEGGGWRSMIWWGRGTPGVSSPPPRLPGLLGRRQARRGFISESAEAAHSRAAETRPGASPSGAGGHEPWRRGLGRVRILRALRRPRSGPCASRAAAQR